MSHEKNTGCVGYIVDYTTQFYRPKINHYKDPYSPTMIQWKVGSFFFHGSNGSVATPLPQGNSSQSARWKSSEKRQHEESSIEDGNRTECATVAGALGEDTHTYVCVYVTNIYIYICICTYIYI